MQCFCCYMPLCFYVYIKSQHKPKLMVCSAIPCCFTGVSCYQSFITTQWLWLFTLTIIVTIEPICKYVYIYIYIYGFYGEAMDAAQRSAGAEKLEAVLWDPQSREYRSHLGRLEACSLGGEGQDCAPAFVSKLYFFHIKNLSDFDFPLPGFSYDFLMIFLCFPLLWIHSIFSHLTK